MSFILNFILHTNFAKSFLSRDFRFAVPPYFNTKIVITYTETETETETETQRERQRQRGRQRQ